MLVLNRKKGQRIIIGNQVELTVLEVHGDRVKLGFSGPAEVPIHREELHKKIVDDCNPRPNSKCSCGWYQVKAG
jgi:carbon storage regulator